ncbi:MAG: hypothetical protein DRP99_02395 [Candidatus Latescibacterota bacterium]|nr:MAG: hypothetical protein DRP99_02395 [Candidatus Latescibacterota bacterium]
MSIGSDILKPNNTLGFLLKGLTVVSLLSTGSYGDISALENLALSIFAPDRTSPARRQGKFVKCLTPIVSSVKFYEPYLSRNAKIALSSLFSRPQLPKSYLSRSGLFRVHYTTEGSDAVPTEDKDKDGIPDFVQEVASALDSAYVLEVEILGYPEPVKDGGAGGDDAWDVYLHDLGHLSTYGFTNPERRIGNSSTSYIEMDNDFQDPVFPTKGLDAIHITAAHEFFHMIHYTYYGRSGWEWWMEISSTWMEDVAYDDVNDYYNYLSFFFGHPEVPLNRYDGSHEYGASVFAHFLEERFGRDIIRRMWEEIGRRQSTSLRIWEKVFPGGWRDVMGEFALWNYFTGKRARPDFYEEGENYPEVRTEEHTSLPDSGQGSLPYLASVYHRFLPRGGSMDFFLSLQEPGVWKGWFVSDGEWWPAGTGESRMEGEEEVTWIGAVGVTEGNYGYRYLASYEASAGDTTGTSQQLAEFPLPNPFLPEEGKLVVRFHLDEPGKVSMEIYTILGRQIWKHEEEFPPGDGKLSWNGRNSEGKPVASGIYIYLLRYGGRSRKGKIALVR